MTIDPTREHVQSAIVSLVQWVRLAVEAVGAAIVATGVGIALVLLVAALVKRRTADFNSIRLVLARYLALALEFQLGADILSTSVDPTLDQITRLAAIAVIRTALNFFLSREMREEQRRAGAEREVVRQAVKPDTAASDPASTGSAD